MIVSQHYWEQRMEAMLTFELQEVSIAVTNTILPTPSGLGEELRTTTLPVCKLGNNLGSANRVVKQEINVLAREILDHMALPQIPTISKSY